MYRFHPSAIYYHRKIKHVTIQIHPSRNSDGIPPRPPAILRVVVDERELGVVVFAAPLDGLRHVAGGAGLAVGGGAYRLTALGKCTHAWSWVRVSTGVCSIYGISCSSRQAGNVVTADR